MAKDDGAPLHTTPAIADPGATSPNPAVPIVSSPSIPPLPPPSSDAGVVRTLRALVVLSLLVPLLVLIGGGYLACRDTFARARAELTQDVAVAEENAIRVLDTHMLVAARVNDLVGRLDDGAIRADQQALHLRLQDMIGNLSQVETVWVVDRAGHDLVSADRYPVDTTRDHTDRDYFRALQDPHRSIFISAIHSRADGQPFFIVARRKHSVPGQFDGVIVVAVSPDYFHAFYGELLGDSPDYIAAVSRDDGANLARYPALVRTALTPGRGDLLMGAVAAHPDSGMIAGRSAIDGVERLIAYRRVTGYPIYVSIGRTRASVVDSWVHTMTTYLYFGVPAALALMLISLLALRRTHREQAAHAREHEAIVRREAAEEALRQSQKMEVVGQLTSGIAHDFNNLLTVIGGNVELLQQRLGDTDARVARIADAAMRGVARAATLTQRLLAFARRQPLDPRPLDVNRLISDMSDLLRRTLGDGIACETGLASGLWPSLVDAQQLEHALLNLAINARDAMPGGGTLTIETANSRIDSAFAAIHEVDAGRYVMVSVSDTGTGMTREVRDKAFEPFFTTKDVQKGTGLGLSQVYGFIKQSGGHILIDSEPGSGTTVNLYLPRFAGERPPDAAPAGDWNGRPD